MTDSFTIRLVVASLAIIALVSVVGALVLAYSGKAIPDAIIALGSACVGAVSGILARTSSSTEREN